MANSSGFVHDFEVVRWAASQLPNLPHIQEHLRQVAEGLEKSAAEAAAALVKHVEESKVEQEILAKAEQAVASVQAELQEQK